MADIIFLVIFFIFIVKGLFKGFLKEIFSLAGFLSGISLAYIYFPMLGRYFMESFTDVKYAAYSAAFFVIFIACVFLFNALGLLLTGFVRAIRLSWLNRAMGGGVGFIKAFVLSLLLVTLLYVSPLSNKIKAQVKNSLIGGVLVRISGMVMSSSDIKV